MRYDLPACLLHVLRELRSRSRSRLQSDTDRVLFGTRVTCYAQITKRLQPAHDGLRDFRASPHDDGHRTERAHHLDRAGITAGSIFRPVDRWGHVGNRAVRRLGVARAVKRALTALDVDTTNDSGHRRHAGLVTAAAMAGVSERVIMQQTGHKNTALVRRYTREGARFSANAAAAVGRSHSYQ